MVRALPCHGRGYGFEPRRSRQSSFGAQRRTKTAAPKPVLGRRWALCMKRQALRTTTRQASEVEMEFSYVYILRS